MRRFEGEHDVCRREFVQVREELKRQHRPTFRPVIRLPSRASGENVFRSGNVGSDFVWLVEQRQRTRQETSEVGGRHATTTTSIGRASQVPQVMVTEFVSQDKPNLFFEQLMLSRHLTTVHSLNRIDKPRRWMGKPPLLSEELKIFVELARPKDFVCRFELRDIRFDLEQPIRDGHQGQTLIVASGKRIHFTRRRIGDKRDVSHDGRFVRRQGGDEFAHDHTRVLPKPIDVHHVDRIDQRRWVPGQTR